MHTNKTFDEAMPLRLHHADHIDIKNLLTSCFAAMFVHRQYALGFLMCSVLAFVLMLYALVIYTPLNCYCNYTHSFLVQDF